MTEIDNMTDEEFAEFEDDLEASPWAVAEGLVEMREVPVIGPDGTVTMRRRVLVTPKGLARLRAELGVKFN